MQTLRFEDRDWIEQQYVRDDNGRLVLRDEYEAQAELREALDNFNTPNSTPAVKSLVQTALIGGILWGMTALISGLI